MLPVLRALALVALLAATAATQSDPTPSVLDGGRLAVIEGSHLRLVLEKDVARVAVGSPERLSWTLVTDRELLLLGQATGGSSLILWFVDGSLREWRVSVQPDLGPLQAALTEIHPSLLAEPAPDGLTLVLRGRVPDLTVRQLAEATARSWLGEGPAPLVTSDGAPQVPQDEAQQRGAAVINLIQVERLPPRMVERVGEVVAESFPDVTVSRLIAGDLPDDDRDVVLLQGEVLDQVALVRLLHLAASLVQGSGQDPDIEVAADEGGALLQGINNQQQNQGFGNSGGGGGGASRLLGGGGNQRLGNRIQSNPGRSTVLSAAGGRILSFVEPRLVPQIRVDVRLYEVNLTDLRNQEGQLGILWGDIPQASLEPTGLATALQGPGATRVGSVTPTDVGNALSFLEDGLRNQLQIVGDNAALDAAFQVLESEGLARTLARPSLTVLSGERALFQVGGEIPVPQSFATNEVAEGVLNSVEFRAFGIQLDVRPLVGADGLVTIDLAPQVSTPSPELTALIRDSTGTDQLTTGFETRTLRTSARLRDGELLVVGGLVSVDQQWSLAEAPWLASIPILGALFRRQAESKDELELVLALHPVLIHEQRHDVALWEFAQARDLLDELLPPRVTSRASSAWMDPPEEGPLQTLRSDLSADFREPGVAGGHDPDAGR